MAAEPKQSCYEGSGVSSFQFYLERSGEHDAILRCVRDFLPQEFKRYKKQNKNTAGGVMEGGMEGGRGLSQGVVLLGAVHGHGHDSVRAHVPKQKPSQRLTGSVIVF